MRKWVAVAVLAVSSVLLTGCEGAVRTDIKFISAEEANITATVVLTGEAASAVYSDQDMVDDLAANMERLTGSKPTMELSDEEVRASTTLTFEQLVASSKITGISGISVESGGNTLGVIVTLVQPENLVQSVRDAASSRADADALAKVMLANTYINFVAEFPGPVVLTEAKNVTAEVIGNTVVVKRGIKEKKLATVKFEGSLNSPSRLLVLGILLGIVGVGLLTVVVVLRRKGKL